MKKNITICTHRRRPLGKKTKISYKRTRRPLKVNINICTNKRGPPKKKTETKKVSCLVSKQKIIIHRALDRHSIGTQ